MPHAPATSTRPSRSERSGPPGRGARRAGRGPRAAEPDAAQRELALLRLPVGHERATLARDLDVGAQPEHGPHAGDPRAGRDDQRLACRSALARRDRARRRRRRARSRRPPRPRGSPRRRRAPGRRGGARSAWRRPSRRGARAAPPRPAPPSRASVQVEVLAAALGADHELGRVAHPLVLLADRHQVVDLALGHRREVADLAEAVGVGLGLEDLHRHPDQLGDRLGAVVVAHDPARAAGRPAADAALVEHHHVGAALGQAPGDRQPVDSAADDDVRGHQLQGYGLFETGCRSPVAKRS